MIYKYIQMRVDSNTFPLDLHNSLPKSQQRLFTFILKRCNNKNQHTITGVEISEQMKISTQLVSRDLIAMEKLDILRRGKHSLLMINPHLWFFGDWYAHSDAAKLWDKLPTTSKNTISGGLTRYRYRYP